LEQEQADVLSLQASSFGLRAFDHVPNKKHNKLFLKPSLLPPGSDPLL
jgi:hypothetical protein